MAEVKTRKTIEAAREALQQKLRARGWSRNHLVVDLTEDKQSIQVKVVRPFFADAISDVTAALKAMDGWSVLLRPMVTPNDLPDLAKPGQPGASVAQEIAAGPTFCLYLRQAGEGCNGPIGCGEAMLTLRAVDITEAEAEAWKVICRQYRGGSELAEALLVFMPACQSLDLSLRKSKEQAAATDKEARRKQYETLREEFADA